MSQRIYLILYTDVIIMAYKTKEKLKKVLTVIVILTMLPISTVTSGLMGETGHTHEGTYSEGGLSGCGDGCDDDHDVTLASGTQVNLEPEPVPETEHVPEQGTDPDEDPDIGEPDDDPYVDDERIHYEMQPDKWGDGYTLTSVIRIAENCPPGHQIRFLACYEVKDWRAIKRNVTWGVFTITVGGR